MKYTEIDNKKFEIKYPRPYVISEDGILIDHQGRCEYQIADILLRIYENGEMFAVWDSIEEGEAIDTLSQDELSDLLSRYEIALDGDSDDISSTQRLPKNALFVFKEDRIVYILKEDGSTVSFSSIKDFHEKDSQYYRRVIIK